MEGSVQGSTSHEKPKRLRDFLAVADERREHRAFVRGYVTALLDIERTGLEPITDKTRRESAERAWRRDAF